MNTLPQTDKTLKQAFSASSPQCPAELIIVHLRFTLPGTPKPGHLVWILDDKLAVVPLPRDDIMILLFPEQLQDEVPKLDLSGPGAWLWLVSPFWKGKPWMDQESNGLVGCNLNSSQNNKIGVAGRHCLYKVSYLFKGRATQTRHFWQCRQNFKVFFSFYSTM